MLDPISALSVAAAVVAFVDFGLKVTKGAYDRLGRGADEEMQFKTVAIELEGKLPQLSRYIRQINEYSDAYSRKISAAKLASDVDLLDLCRDAEVVGLELQTCINTIRRGKVGTSRPAGLRGALGKLKPSTKLTPVAQAKLRFEVWDKELGRIEKEISRALLVTVWSDNKEILALLRAISLGQLEDRRKKELEDIRYGNTPTEHHLRSADETVEEGSQIESDESLQTRIISSLSFSGMGYRGDAITEAYKKTFEWIYKDLDEVTAAFGGVQWDHFPSWIQGNRHLYWITGKPGAGKSTLMKYIWGHPQLRQLLGSWAKDRPLLMACFFSWNAGNDALQKSEEGLLRTVLHQILKQRPELVLRVCPKPWAYFAWGGTAVRRHGGLHWTMKELTESFDLLLDTLRESDLRLALLIDGLDEFEASDRHERLINLTQGIHQKVESKICVSSREWSQFADAFHQIPRLRLQDLTKKDIEQYVRDKYSCSQGFQELQQAYRKQSEEFLNEMISKAKGVFLWITIVSKILLEELQEGNAGITELHAALHSIPPDLSDLYQGIWDKLPGTNKFMTSQLLQLIKAHVGPASLTTMFVATEKDPYIAIEVAERDLQKLLKRRVRSTRGLLEIDNGHTVEYTHRTAEEWTQAHWDDIVKMSPHGFDPNIRLLGAKVADMSTDSFWAAKSSWDSVWSVFQVCLYYGFRVPREQAFQDQLAQHLDRLDKDIARAWVRNYGGSTSKHWSSTQVRGRTTDRLCNSFVGLVAQYPIVDYVKTKVRQNSDINTMSARDRRVTLLENALFMPSRTGRDLRSRDEYQDLRMTASRFNAREELIEFLFHHGADPRQDTVLFRQCGLVDTDLPELSRWSADKAKAKTFFRSSPVYPLYKVIPELDESDENAWKPISKLFAAEIRKRSLTSWFGKKVWGQL